MCSSMGTAFPTAAPLLQCCSSAPGPAPAWIQDGLCCSLPSAQTRTLPCPGLPRARTHTLNSQGSKTVEPWNSLTR